MEKYKGAVCPVCLKKITETDDVVVCPDCGAPHHRECWSKLGHCGCIELHATGQTWHNPAETETAEPEATESATKSTTPPESGTDDRAAHAPESGKKICPACHAENNPDAAFCSSCGMPLNGAAFSAANGVNPQQAFRILTDPLGGVPPEEEIDGVSARQLGELVGRNSAYYIPRFREISKGNRRFLPNLSAFLFDIPWFFYRKMALPGLGVLILELALASPSVWMIAQAVIYGNSASFSDTFYTLYNICSILQLLLRIGIGFFANKIYLLHCTGLARRLNEKYPDGPERQNVTRKKGGVATAILFIWLALMVVFYIAQLVLLI